MSMFDKILLNLNTLSHNNAFFREYYQNLSETNSVSELVQFKNDLQQNRNYLPLNQISPRKKGLNLSKDEVIAGAETFGSNVDPPKEKDQEKEDDFDYE